MTLTGARQRAHERVRDALPEAVQGRVIEIDGAVTGKEIQRQQMRLPSVQVAVLGRSDAGIRLAVYLVADARVPAVHDLALGLLDTIEEALRMLPNRNLAVPKRALLEVRTQALWDADMMARGGVALWAVTTTWPDLAAEDDPSAETGGMLAAANELLTPAIDAALGDEQDPASRKRRRGMTELDRSRLALEGPLPYAEVRHGPGAIQRRGSGSGAARWPDGEAGRPLGPAPAVGQSQTRQAARGTRAWTATITLWAGTTAQVDAALTTLLRLLPRRWRWRGQENLVTVGRLDGPTYVASAGAFRVGVDVALAAVALAGEPTTIRTVRGAVQVRPRGANPLIVGEDANGTLREHVPPLEREQYQRPDAGDGGGEGE